MSVANTIESVISSINSPRFTTNNEGMTKRFAIEPILSALGWKEFGVMTLEYPINGGKAVDYALCPNGHDPAVFIEAKAADTPISVDCDAETQLFRYVANVQVPIAVLTNGIVWNVYTTRGYGPPRDRLVHKIDLAERTPEDAAEMLTRYLAFSRVQDNQALQSLEQDHSNTAKKATARRAIDPAWAALIGEPDSFVVELLAEKAQSLCGTKPEDEDVLNYLREVYRKLALSNHQPRPQPMIGKPAAADLRRIGVLRESSNGGKERYWGDVSDLISQKLVEPGQAIWREYQGTTYQAHINEKGEIVFSDGKYFSSPSAAGRFITKSSDRGWTYFFTRTKEGNIVSLHQLRLQLVQPS